MSSAYIIGIDLGTTNCAMAFARAEAGAQVTDFPVPQLVQAGQLAPLPLLSSGLYLPGEGELPQGAAALPWDAEAGVIAGEYARWLGSRVPGRSVLSSKSWLCHSGVDRSAPILPWAAPAGERRISPVDAAERLLSHMAGAWDQAHPEAPLREQDLIITVPASFDEVARSLTVEAARRAGLTRLSLVEEPQAAFHDFVRCRGEGLAEALRGVRLVLVIDVGGGTTDLTLIQVGEGAEGVELRRIAVGEHLMLGGDNMDIALARLAESRLAPPGSRLPPAQWIQLVHAARAAKEALLSPEAPERHPFSIAGSGSRLIGSTLSGEFAREELQRCVLEGFLPASGAAEPVRRSLRGALQELGLPYAQDPVIPRHIASFLRQHAEAASAALGEPGAGTGLPRPDAILLNGGVFKSPLVVDTLLARLGAWWPEAGVPRLLEGASLDLAVARGAVSRGLARRGLVRAISGGSAHSLFIGVEGGRVVCVLPRGSAEGAVVELPERRFHLSLGAPVSFPLYASNDDKPVVAGALCEPWEGLQALPPLQTVLHSGGTAGEAEVHLRAALTELGTLALSCVEEGGPGLWQLEFDLRRGLAEAGGQEGRAAEELVPPIEALELLETFFGIQPRVLAPKDFKMAFRQLEQHLGPREEWPLPLLRSLWARLDELAPQRRRSPEHERLYFQLAGYFLRPGFGHPLDDWRCERALRLLGELLKYPGEQSNWNEFWIFWRRVAPGLGQARQVELWDLLMPHLARRIPLKPSKNLPRPKGVQFEGLEEMLRVAASLELVQPAEKQRLGGWLVERLRANPKAPGPWAWALGRLGARVPLHASVHKVLPAELASEWLSLLLDFDLARIEGGAFAAAQLARLSGDRGRDLSDALRSRCLGALAGAGASQRLARLVSEQVDLDVAEQAKILGDSLPLGLRLV
jgi:molecular chaperone DnaK (HSP70)